MSTTAAAVLTYPHITRDPAIRGGRPCLDRTRIAVGDVVAAHIDGHRPQEIQSLFGATLTLAQVHAALVYYYDHPNEIDEEFRGADAYLEKLETDRAAFFKARS